VIASIRYGAVDTIVIQNELKDPMRFSNLLALACLTALLLGCGTHPKQTSAPPADSVPIDKVQIPGRFQTVELTRETYAEEVVRCVPLISETSERIFRNLDRFPTSNITVFGHMYSANQFWINKTTGMCLRRSSEQFPIFAAEAFYETANPRGVPPDVADGWYKQIAFLMAARGKVKVAYVFEKGTACIVDYWTEPRKAYQLQYSSSFRKEGAWESENIDLRFSYRSMSSVGETTRGGATVKGNLLSHRLP